MAYVTKQQIEQARAFDLLSYLQNYAPQELVRICADTYCTKAHDSLKISNGKWHWFSRGIGGKTALDYLIKVQNIPFTEAVEMLAGRAAPSVPVLSSFPKKSGRELLIPAAHSNNDRVSRYLEGRGIHHVVIDHFIENKMLFEDVKYHNAVFIGYDEGGVPKYGNVRGTRGNFKGELSGSNKRYSFCMSGESAPHSVHIFESAIDLMSYATLSLYEGNDWRSEHLVSLAGVYEVKRENVLPIALEQFLSTHPQIEWVSLHLDNDTIGRAAAKGITAALQKKYTVFDEPPEYGKDYNDMLKKYLGITKNKEDYVR